MIRSRAPCRISLSGGGTDIDPYRSEYGGLTLSATIDRYAIATIDKAPLNVYQSGFALNAHKFFRRTSTIAISHFTEAPPGSGLGGSSALVVAIVKGLSEFYGRKMDSEEIARAAYKIEREDMEIKGGWQDQFGASYGGFNMIDFSKNRIKVVRLDIAEETVRELLASFILVDLGMAHDSSDLIDKQIESFKNPKSLETLDKMKDMTKAMVVEVLAGNVKELGPMLTEEWNLKKSLESHISNPEINGFHSLMLQNGALGGKLLGAGDGGHLLFIADISKRQGLIETIVKSGYRYVSFKFDNQGAVSWTI